MSTTPTPLPGQSSQGSEKANWDSIQTTIFVDLCVQQVKEGRRPGSHFTREVWQKIIAGFTEQTGRRYDQPQMKNKWDNLKKEFKLWEKLRLHDTGTGWDNVRNTILADNEWWEQRIKEDKRVAKFRITGPENLEQLELLFGGLCATGEAAYIPGSSRPANAVETGENIGILSVDTEESTDPSYDIAAEIEAEVNSPHSTPVRQRRRSLTPASRGKKRRRASDIRADLSASMDKLVSAVNSRTNSIASVLPGGNKAEIVDCLRILEGIPEVACGGPLLEFALNLFQDKGKREYFSCIFREDWRLNWLRTEFKNAGGGGAAGIP